MRIAPVTSSTIPYNALGADSSALSRPRYPEPREKAFPLAVPVSRNRLPSPIKPRYTTCSSRMMMDHGKPAADFQRVDSGIGDIAGTPDTAWDRRLTPVYWPVRIDVEG